MLFNSFNRVDPANGFAAMGIIRVNPRQVVAFGPFEANKTSGDDAEAQDAQGNAVTEILLSTGHLLFVSEIPSEVDRRFSGGY